MPGEVQELLGHKSVETTMMHLNGIDKKMVSSEWH